MKPRHTVLYLLVALLLAVPAPAAADDASEVLGTLWAQTSAEYRALCTEVYGTATHCLTQRVHLENFKRDAPGRLLQTCLVDGRAIQRPVAVIMDLDETVIDNSGFQVWLLRQHLGYSPARWQQWVHYQATHPQTLRSVPGAVAFIRAAERLGVSVLYVSDREATGNGLDDGVKIMTGLGVGTRDLRARLRFDLGRAEEHAAALALLHQLGLSETSAPGRELLDAQGKKARRRLEATLHYDVIGYFGDNLYDFPVYVAGGTPPGRADLDARRAQVEHNAAHWGTDWFVLPNPVYGSWQPGAALPRTHLLDSLDDRGFGAYMKAHAPGASTPAHH